ncbi:MAG: hypothetical protein CVU12_10015 [Bacteroidetes bacterium HGW-Bacteroidetes-7]|jgi:hypothetical protein|nr:MAG: hypothetical protein CVU12_10015 [Bacteroidetes bacterium HGW-Bacteroidetes-7]
MINQNSGNLSEEVNKGEDKISDFKPETPQEIIDPEIPTLINENKVEIANTDKEDIPEGDAVAQEAERHVCKNCETEFTGHFCNNCGQSAKDFNRPVSVLIVDAMSNMWAFDTRLWKTLKSIMFKPGEMALDYMAGKRVRYMPPFRLYLFISFIFFLLLRLSTSADTNIKLISIEDKAEVSKKEQVVEINPEYVDLTAIQNQINNESKKEISEKDKKGKNGKRNFEEVKQNKELYISRFFTYLSWALIVMMPLYAMILWFLFRKQQKHYLAHFIFSLNQHAFLFVIFSILITISLIFPQKQTLYEAWLLLIFPVYLIAGGRKLYKAKWSKIILRMVTAFFLYQIIIVSMIILVLYMVLYKFF